MAWELLYGSDTGLLSIFTIGFVLVMGLFMSRFFTKKMDEESRN